MKKLFTFCSVFSVAASLSAQTIVWGTGSSNATQDSIGRFASVDGTLAGAGWATTGTPAAALWEWSADGTSTGFLTPGWVSNGTASYITSPSLADGCGMFHSDLLDGGTAGPGASGVAPAPHSSEMWSPIIDLTGYTDSIVAAHFYTAFFEFDITEMSVGLSLDNGGTWTDVDVRFHINGANHTSGYLARYNGWATVNFPPILDGVTDLDSCRLRFKFNGRYYFWSVDDLSLRIGNAYDLTYNALTDVYDFNSAAYPVPFQEIPSSQAPDMRYVYSVWAYNRGAYDIPASANPRVQIDVESYDGSTYTNVYSTTVNFGQDIPRGDTVSISGDLNYAPPASDYLRYRMTYTLMHDLSDDNSNDTTRRWFEVTDEVNDAWYAPGGLDANGVPRYDRTLSLASSAPSNGTDILQEHEFGNFFYFPNNTGLNGNNVVLDSVRYNIYLSPLLEPSLTQLIISVFVYEWVDNGDGNFDWAELQLRTLAPDTVNFTSADYSTYKTRTVPIVDPNNFNPVTLQYDYPYPVNPDAFYLITLHQQNYIDGLVDLAGNRRCFFLTRRTMVYEDHPGLESLSAFRYFTGLPNQTGTQQGWYTGFTDAPHDAPGMAAYTRTLLPVSVELVQEVKGNVLLFPNPTQGMVTTKVDLEKQSATVRYVVTDAIGRILHIEYRKNLQSDVFQYDASRLPQGIYFVNIKTDEGTISKRFVKE